MDEPTRLEITIRGNELEVKRAALVAQRRVELDTNGFKEEMFVFGDGSDAEEKIKKAVGFGDFKFTKKEDGTVEYETEQESYGLIWQEDVEAIAEDIKKVSPNVEARISAVITTTSTDGYDLCVEVEYKNENIKVDVTEDYYEDEDLDEEEEEDEEDEEEEDEEE